MSKTNEQLIKIADKLFYEEGLEEFNVNFGKNQIVIKLVFKEGEPYDDVKPIYNSTIDESEQVSIKILMEDLDFKNDRGNIFTKGNVVVVWEISRWLVGKASTKNDYALFEDFERLCYAVSPENFTLNKLNELTEKFIK